MSASRTYFACPDRTAADEIEREALDAARSPLLRSVLRLFGGVIAVLDPNRQIIGLNDELLSLLGVRNPDQALGLRLGEAFRCPNAAAAPSGCGTGQACADCGAAIATVLAQKEGEPQERECCLAAKDGTQDLDLRVRAMPVDLDGRRYLVIALQDIRDFKRGKTIERVFFHDLKNSLAGLIGTASLLSAADESRRRELARAVETLAIGLADEVEGQEALEAMRDGHYRTRLAATSRAEADSRLRLAFAHHPLLKERSLRVESDPPAEGLLTDADMLHRVLVNLTKNALEACPAGGEVEVRSYAADGQAVWAIRNPGIIPADIATRLFRRYFSTKGGSGRGLGLYSAKLFTEQCLRGTLDWRSDEERGTLFRVSIPSQAEGA